MSTVDNREDKVNDFEVAEDKPTSESLLHKIGGGINFLIDQTDDQSSQLDIIEGKQITWSGVASITASLTSDTTIQSAAITPVGQRVSLFCAGYLNDPGFFTLELRRNGVTIFNFENRDLANARRDLGPVVDYPSKAISLACLNFIDTGATAGLSNTYSIVWVLAGSTTNPPQTITGASILAVEV